MEYYLLQYRSMTYAQRAKNILSRMGISSYLLRTPKRIAKAGCSYSVRVRSLSDAMDVLVRMGAEPMRVFWMDGSGNSREVGV